MSRSKKNYDVLIDKHGNYDFSAITNAIKGDKGDRGYQGQKGELGLTGGPGRTGDKGDSGGVFNWKGDVGSAAALPPANPDTLGDLYLANDTEIFHVSNGDGTYTELLDLTLVQGDKGETGDKGTDGLPGLGGGKGEKGDNGQKGVKGDLGPQGHKGNSVKGDKGQKGDHGFPGTDGTDGLDGEKGEGGTNGHEGQKGEPGIDAANPLFTLMGEVATYNDLPSASSGTEGHTYRVLDRDSYFASDGRGNYIDMPEVSSLKGDKGDGFVYGDFTPEQILDLKGQKGDKGQTGTAGQDGKDGDKGEQFDFSDFTQSDKDTLKGEKGDKGKAFEYSDFSQSQINELKGEPGTNGTNGADGVSTQYIIKKQGNVYYVELS